jgi:hypothetical protein
MTATPELKKAKEIANIVAERLQKVNQNVFCPCEECLRVEDGILNTFWDLRFVTISFRTSSAKRHAGS